MQNRKLSTANPQNLANNVTSIPPKFTLSRAPQSFSRATIYFWKDTGYFRADSSLNPLLMTWSLGVEEQFYLLFPFLILIIVRFRYRFRLAALTLACALSFALSIYLTTRSSGSAFYLLPPRAWEMGVGALLAMAHIMRPDFAYGLTSKSDVLAGLAALVLITSLTTLHDIPFPGWAASLPVGATATLIHTRGSWLNKVLLGSWPFVAVGLVSYSWYLWHWPLMSFVRIASDEAPCLTVMICVAAISLGVGTASQRWIEAPFRHSDRAPAPTLIWYGCGLAFVLSLPLSFIWLKGVPARLPPKVIAAEALAQKGRGEECLLEFGEYQPRSDDVCMPKHATIALLGDSHAAALSPGLIEEARRQGTQVLRLTKSSCSPLLGFTNIYRDHPEHMTACQTFLALAIAKALHDRDVSVVVISGAAPKPQDQRYRRDRDLLHPVAIEVAIPEGLGSLIKLFQAAGKAVVVVGDVPQFSFDPMRHLTTEALPPRRLIARATGTFLRTADGRSSDVMHEYEGPSKLLEIVALKHGAEFIDLRQQFCNVHGCAFSKDGVPLFFDSHHLSEAGAHLIDWLVMRCPEGLQSIEPAFDEIDRIKSPSDFKCAHPQKSSRNADPESKRAE